MLAAADSSSPTGKKSEDNLFDLIDPTKVNKHLQELMPGLTIKVFRTYNASITLSRLLKETDEALDVPGKKAQVRGATAFRQMRLCSDASAFAV
jgi:DNA topoisomerase-1